MYLIKIIDFDNRGVCIMFFLYDWMKMDNNTDLTFKIGIIQLFCVKFLQER